MIRLPLLSALVLSAWTGTVEAASLSTINGCQGLHMRVSSQYASRFQAFFCDLTSMGHKFRDVTCQAWGHMPGSKHHDGRACDVDQLSRSVTQAKVMYHVSALAQKHGLIDGCTWGNRDCGHIEAPGPNNGRRHYASRHHRHYASRSHHFGSHTTAEALPLPY